MIEGFHKQAAGPSGKITKGEVHPPLDARVSPRGSLWDEFQAQRGGPVTAMPGSRSGDRRMRLKASQAALKTAQAAKR